MKETFSVAINHYYEQAESLRMKLLQYTASGRERKVSFLTQLVIFLYIL